ncbi:MAG TPA: alpha/beta hydrolase [Longimicrobium sp.]|jgi:pimeloyl-ACP methyl ester carboxylesterase|nr:alpha/beta hydrolase [Longimicrobium sp.]
MTAGAARTAEPKVRRVEADGAGLHLLDWGGGGTPLLLLPGMGQSAHIFRTLVPALGGRFRAVAVTPRAHGESDTPEAGYTLASFAADVCAVMDALEIGRAAVVAHSVGGAVATRLAADAPERVSHLVYLDSLTDYAGLGRIAARSPVRPPVLPPGASDAAERAWHRAFTYGLWNEAVEADWRARPDISVRRHRRELLADFMDDVVHAREPFAALRCPALALMAQESVATQFPWLKPDDPRRPAAEAYLRDIRAPWRRASAERFRREAGDARVAEVPGNHFFFLASPQRTATEIRGFLHSA